MKFIVSKGDVEITFECDGEIVPIKTNDGNSYVKALFSGKSSGRIVEFQTIVKRGDDCTLKTETETICGTYVAPSSIDQTPIIKLLTLN